MNETLARDEWVPLRHLPLVKKALRDPIKKEVRDILTKRKTGLEDEDWQKFLEDWQKLAVRIQKGAKLIRREQAEGRDIDEYLHFYSLLLEVMGFYCMVARFDNRTFYDRHIGKILDMAE